MNVEPKGRGSCPVRSVPVGLGMGSVAVSRSFFLEVEP